MLSTGGMDMNSSEDMVIDNLRCEYATNPIGVDITIPELSWTVRSSRRGQRQRAYRVLVASSREELEKNKGDLWDSEKVESNRSTHVPYRGDPLESNQDYFWKVQVWGELGKASNYSPIGKFGTALLTSGDWRAKWVGMGPCEEPHGNDDYYDGSPEEIDEDAITDIDKGSVLLRKEISLEKPARRIKVFVCGLGFYELSINGKRIGDKVLNPAKTNYREQVLYDTYDVTDHMEKGKNAIGVHLGNGWFNPLKKYWSWRMQWFGSKRMILQMHIDYQDGSSQVVISDESWKCTHGPIITSCIYDGERYDARRELPGWDGPDYDDSDWQKVDIANAPGGRMVSQIMEAIKVIEVIKPVGVSNPEPGVYVYDMGQNFAGWARLRVGGPQGTEIKLRYGENIDEDGALDVKSMNLAKATGTYILKGEAEEIYEPSFVYYGFRYVEMTGFPGEPGIEDLDGCVVHSACERTGSFECSNALINSIHQCVMWSQRSNLMGYPTDCPQRDERLGWLGDAHLTAEEAMLNLHMPLFYRNWLSGIKSNRDKSSGDIPRISPRPLINSGQPDWSSGYPLIAWYYYLHYGDIRILVDHFEAMESYVKYLGTTAKDHILPKSRYGDWLSVAEGWERGDPLSTTTGFYYYDAVLVSKIAGVLGKEEDSQRYAELAEQIRNAYNQRFFNPENSQYGDGTQFSNAFPLFLGIVPEEHRESVLQDLIQNIVDEKDGHLTTGVIGTKYMMEVLTDEDRSDIAYLLATQTSYPSWIDMIKARTTLSEHWNGKGSNNHVMFGSIDTWFYRVLAGINIDEDSPGYGKVIIHPFLHSGLTWVRARIETVRGRIAVEWERGKQFYKLRISIPVNATATVYVLAGDVRKVEEGGNPATSSPGVEFLREEGKHFVFKVGSGSYEFVSR